MKEFIISIPASSANLGPAFDSGGIALNLYLTLKVAESDQWELISQSPFLPTDANYEENLIYQVAKETAKRHNKQLPTCKLTINSDIPLARGFGSSASAIIAGIELANQACELSLSLDEKLTYGTEFEGHPDNIAPSLFGGLTITSNYFKNNVDLLRIPDLDLDVVGYIPEFELETKAARGVLPAYFSKEQATTASSVSNVLIASLFSGNYELAGKMMENDLFHEPYRSELIPHYHEIKKEAKRCGAYGTVISGAGPTMVSFAEKGTGKSIVENMQQFLQGYQVSALQIDTNGLQITNTIKTAVE